MISRPMVWYNSRRQHAPVLDVMGGARTSPPRVDGFLRYNRLPLKGTKMDYETAQKVEKGEMPSDFYRVAHNERELVSLLEKSRSCHTISEDTKPGRGLAFFRNEGNAFFWTDEFLDDDGGVQNPDFHVEEFSSVADGVRNFKINGKSVVDAVCGARFAENDIPTPPPLDAV